MKIISAQDCPQGSDVWWEMRKGRITASGMDRILTPKTRKPSAQQEGYIAELIGDLTCQCPKYFTEQGRPVNKYMEYGQQTEAEARRFYEMETGASVLEVGMCITDDDRFSCSPDGLVEPDGGLELKCPMQKTHVEYLLKGEVPSEYLMQMHGSLIVTGRAWWDFMSYAPGLKPLLIRVTPNDLTEALRKELEAFYMKYEATKKQLGVRREDEVILSDEAKAQLQAWHDQLAREPTREALNSWLHELSQMVPEAKRAAWNAIKIYAEKKGWIFNASLKVFEAEVPSETF